MNFFHQKSRLVGGLVPPPIADALSLYVLFSRQTRSKIITKLLTEKLSQHPTEEMITKISLELSKQMEGSAVSKQQLLFDKIRKALQKKKINPQHIAQIIIQMRQFHAENKKTK